MRYRCWIGGGVGWSRPGGMVAVVLVGVVGLLACWSLGARAAGAAACPGIFRVVRDNRVGAVSIPAGSYRLTPSGRLSCAKAPGLLARFLRDYDGRLPGGWTADTRRLGFVDTARPGTGLLLRLVVPVAGESSVRLPGAGRCPGTFGVAHNDRVRSLSVSAGRYWITVLGARPLSCGQASTLFARFLARPDGRLPAPWRLDAATGAFTRGHGPAEFRVKPATQPTVGVRDCLPRQSCDDYMKVGQTCTATTKYIPIKIVDGRIYGHVCMPNEIGWAPDEGARVTVENVGVGDVHHALQVWTVEHETTAHYLKYGQTVVLQVGRQNDQLRISGTDWVDKHTVRIQVISMQPNQ